MIDWAINPIPPQPRWNRDRHGRFAPAGAEHHAIPDVSFWWQNAAASGSLGDAYMRSYTHALHIRPSFYHQHLTKAHEPRIEGLKHGWGQMQGRGATGFGSGWQGLQLVFRAGESMAAGAGKVAYWTTDAKYAMEYMRPGRKLFAGFIDASHNLDLLRPENRTHLEALINKPSGIKAALQKFGLGAADRAAVSAREQWNVAEHFAISGDNKYPFRKPQAEYFSSHGFQSFSRPETAHASLGEGPVRERFSKSYGVVSNDAIVGGTEIWAPHGGSFDEDLWKQQALRSAQELQSTVDQVVSRTSAGQAHSVAADLMRHFGSRAGRQTQIEGLRHGWHGAQRKSNTDFGSGWRGLISVPTSVMGAPIAGLAISDATTWDLAKQKIQEHALTVGGARAKRYLRDIEQADQYIANTGYLPVLMNDALRGPSLRAFIRHERIHAAHVKHINSNVFQQEVKKSLPFEKALRKDIEHRYRHHLRDTLEFEMAGLPAGSPKPNVEAMLATAKQSPHLVEGAIKQNYSQNAFSYGTSARSFRGQVPLLDMERLAYSNQYDRGFWSRIRKQGIQTLPHHPRPDVVKAVMETGKGSETASNVLRSIKAIGSRIMSRAL